MKLIVEVGGIKVYSDKNLSSITGNVVSFSDGSWCDVSSKQIVNKGAGSISLDVPPKGESSENKKKIKTFSGSKLDISKVSAKVDIQPYEGAEIEVTIEGPDNEIKAIDVRLSGDTVFIAGIGASGSNKSNINIQGSNIRISGVSNASINTRGGDFHLGSGGIFSSSTNIIMGDSDESSVKVSIRVPKGLSIALRGIEGRTTVLYLRTSNHAARWQSAC